MSQSNNHWTSLKFRYWWPAALWLVIILSISLFPGNDIPSIKIPHFDKLVHFGVYLILTVLVFYGFSEQYHFPELRFKITLAACLFAFLWGTLMELLQYFITDSRHFEYLDILANIIGSLTGAGAFILFFKLKEG